MHLVHIFKISMLHNINNDKDSLQSFDESGKEVGHSAADLWAVVSQSSLVQKCHLFIMH